MKFLAQNKDAILLGMAFAVISLLINKSLEASAP